MIKSALLLLTFTFFILVNACAQSKDCTLLDDAVSNNEFLRLFKHDTNSSYTIVDKNKSIGDCSPLHTSFIISTDSVYISLSPSSQGHKIPASIIVLYRFEMVKKNIMLSFWQPVTNRTVTLYYKPTKTKNILKRTELGDF